MYKYGIIGLALLLISTLSACNGKLGPFKENVQTGKGYFTPTPFLLRNLPKGNDSYSQGFRDGCETFLGIVGSGALRLLPATIDGYRLSEDQLYARGWSDGGTHCTFYLDWDIH